MSKPIISLSNLQSSSLSQMLPVTLFYTWENADVVRLSYYLLNQEVMEQWFKPRHIPCATYQPAVSCLCHLLVGNKSNFRSVSLCIMTSVAGERWHSFGCDMWSQLCHYAILWMIAYGQGGLPPPIRAAFLLSSFWWPLCLLSERPCFIQSLWLSFLPPE